MDITTMASWFDILQDKNGSAYFTDSEKDLFLNRAQLEFVRELLEGDGKRELNAESTQDTMYHISPLIFEIPYTTMNSSGVVLKSALTTAIQNIDADAIIWRPLAIGIEIGKTKVPAKFMRHNDRWEFEKNVFKRPTTENPRVRETYNSYIFKPVNMSARVYFTLLKYPLEMDITNTVDCELPDSTHNRIVAIALEFAGIGTRDTMMTQLLQLQQKQ